VSAFVVAVSVNPEHILSKVNKNSIRLVRDVGIVGDAHAGKTDQHLSHSSRDPKRPNLRQVHLIHAEFYEELNGAGFSVLPGQLGENITTQGLELLKLPSAARLFIGDQTALQVTGLRDPCKKLNDIQAGLMEATIERNSNGGLIRKTGIMSVVIKGGEIKPGDPIRVEMPPEPYKPMGPV